MYRRTKEEQKSGERYQDKTGTEWDMKKDGGEGNSNLNLGQVPDEIFLGRTLLPFAFFALEKLPFNDPRVHDPL